MNSRQRRRLERAYPHRAFLYWGRRAHDAHFWLENNLPSGFQIEQRKNGMEFKFSRAQDLTWFSLMWLPKTVDAEMGLR
jgi:hypothetical protein